MLLRYFGRSGGKTWVLTQLLKKEARIMKWKGEQNYENRNIGKYIK